MKRLLLLIMFLPVFLNAQDVVDTYELNFFEDPFEIQAKDPGEKDFKFYVNVPPVESSHLTALIIDDNKIEDFKTSLKKAREVYAEWTNTAIENEVTDLEKEIEWDRVKMSSAFSYGTSWHFDYATNLMATFRVIDGTPLLIIENTDKLQASDNQFMNVRGFNLIFTSPEEIDMFLSKIDKSKVEKYYADQNSKKDLFKQ